MNWYHLFLSTEAENKKRATDLPQRLLILIVYVYIYQFDRIEKPVARNAAHRFHGAQITSQVGRSQNDLQILEIHGRDPAPSQSQQTSCMTLKFKY